jgi:hypothetical protein
MGKTRNQITEIALFTEEVPGLAIFYKRLTGSEPLFASSVMALLSHSIFVQICVTGV